MKTVYIVRHSKAEQNFLGADFERKLTEVGKLNSELMANRLLVKQTAIDLFISSPAKRAKTTAQQFAQIYKVDKESIVYKSELYHAPDFVYTEVIKKLDDTSDSIIVFAHNPGITDFINGLGLVQLDNMPTSGVFGFTCNTSHWIDVEKSKKSFLYFDYPKMIK